ncbi:hypothetical protein D3C86_1355410 [compost metagenome]
MRDSGISRISPFVRGYCQCLRPFWSRLQTSLFGSRNDRPTNCGPRYNFSALPAPRSNIAATIASQKMDAVESAFGWSWITKCRPCCGAGRLPVLVRSFIPSGSVAMVSEINRTQLQAASSCITDLGVTSTPASLAIDRSMYRSLSRSDKERTKPSIAARTRVNAPGFFMRDHPSQDCSANHP